MFTGNRLNNFDSNTDCLGIAKSLDVEVKYEIDMDGHAIIYDVVISRLIHDGAFSKEGKREYLVIGSEWLSQSTISDLANEIEQNFFEKKAELEIERAELRKEERWNKAA